MRPLDGTLTTLYRFCATLWPQCPDGAAPGRLMQAANGNLYGTTAYGGAHGGGLIFKLTPAGTRTTLYSFCSQFNCADGKQPEGALIQAKDGALYGTTTDGGNSISPDSGARGGIVFKITLKGDLTTLYSFCSQPDCADGYGPVGALIQASSGVFFGTTEYGGAGQALCSKTRCGTVFKIFADGTLTTLHKFRYLKGANPRAGLLQATDGLFLGTTAEGGPTATDGRGGTVYSLAVGLEPFLVTQTASGAVGSPVSILGNRLTGALSVTFNGTAAAFAIVSDSALAATVPTGATTGFVEVTLRDGTTLDSDEVQGDAVTWRSALGAHPGEHDRSALRALRAGGRCGAGAIGHCPRVSGNTRPQHHR